MRKYGGGGKGVAARVGAARIAAGRGGVRRKRGQPLRRCGASSPYTGEPRTTSQALRRQLPPSHRNAPSGHSGVAHGLFSDSAPTHLRCAGVPLGLFGKPKRSSFSRVRGLHQAILCSFLQNAHALGSLCEPYGCLRTDPALRAAPVFRSAYLKKRVRCTLFFKTLALQSLRDLRRGAKDNSSVRCGGQLPLTSKGSQGDGALCLPCVLEGRAK